MTEDGRSISFQSIMRSARTGSRDLFAFARFANVLEWARWMRLRLDESRYARRSDGSGALRMVRFRGDSVPLAIRPRTSDFKVVEEIYLQGEYDALAKLLLRPSPLIVDLGSNIGVFLRFAAQLWPSASFVAVEPEPSNFAVLSRNAGTLISGNRVHLLQACAGAASGTTTLTGSGWAVQMTGDRGDNEVAVVTMEQILNQLHIDRVDLLKCDIEGAEEALFHDCRAWINKIGALVVEVHAPYSLAELEGDLLRNGSLLRRKSNLPSHNSTYLFV